MPINQYDGLEFSLDNATGEAKLLFGALPVLPGKKAPTLKIDIDRKTSFVTFTFTANDATPDPGRNIAQEASARYIDGKLFDSQWWPDEANDVIIGHLNWGDKTGKQQLFLMWVRPDMPMLDPQRPLRINFFIFANATRFSSCSGGMMVPGEGEDNGGGSGTGPNR